MQLQCVISPQKYSHCATQKMFHTIWGRMACNQKSRSQKFLSRFHRFHFSCLIAHIASKPKDNTDHVTCVANKNPKIQNLNQKIYRPMRGPHFFQKKFQNSAQSRAVHDPTKILFENIRNYR